ncbi:MAG: glycosyl hydrolase family 17 protein [Desulfobacterales bacterium]
MRTRAIGRLPWALLFLLAAQAAAAFSEAPFVGINYGPFHRPGLYPGAPEEPTEAEIVADLRAIAQAGFRRVRTYGLEGVLSRIAPLAERHAPGLRFLVGVHACGSGGGGTPFSPRTRAQLAAAVALARSQSNLDALVIGNECLPGEPEACPEPVRAGEWIAGVAALRRELGEAGRSLPVTVALSMTAALDAERAEAVRIASHADFLLVNVHPFFAPVAVERAVFENLEASIGRLEERFRRLGKPVFIGETGWPSAGAPNGPARPGVAAQRRFVHDLSRYARTRKRGVLLFEMFDEPWKERERGGVGPHWGLFDAERRPKFDLPSW